MLPPSTSAEERSDDLEGSRRLTWGVRLSLVLVAAGLAGVFALSAWLNPYYDDGTPRTMETHTQLGLPDCTFKTMTGKPCPSCGMTTAFALLLHGDPVSSFEANCIGTLLAVFLILVLPWSAACLIRNRLILVGSLEMGLTWTIGIVLTLLLIRWAFVLI